MGKQISSKQFFTELSSYMGAVGNLASGPNALQGMGVDALLNVTDIFSKFGSIKGLLYLEWEGKVDKPVVEGGLESNAPVSIPYAVDDAGMHRLYLPVTRVEAPYSGVESIVVPFRRDFQGNPVNLLVYKDTKSIVIKLALILRSSPTSPWVKYFQHIIEDIVTSAEGLRLCVPRLGVSDSSQGGTTNNCVKGHISGFSVGSLFENSSAALLTFLPESQGVDLMGDLGL